MLKSTKILKKLLRLESIRAELKQKASSVSRADFPPGRGDLKSLSVSSPILNPLKEIQIGSVPTLLDHYI